MLVEKILSKARERLATINADALVKEAADIMSKPHTDLVVVCGRDGSMVGIITKTDIIAHIRQCSGADCTASVETIMKRQVVSCYPSDVLQDILLVMKERGLQRIPVVDKYGTAMGIVYARDALQHLLSQSEFDESQLRDYVMGVGYR